MSMNSEAVASAAVEAGSLGLPELKDYIESGKSNLKFVISGRMGVGKSALINSLIGKNVAEEALSPCAITTEITAYKLQIEATDPDVAKKVEVLVIDCPGLGDPVNNEEANLAAISEHCRDADLLIYCIDMRGRFTTDDASGINEFNRRVGSGIWKNTMFVLTFANQVLLSADSRTKGNFISLLKEWGEVLLKFFRIKVELPEELISDIILVPAGHRNSPPPDRTDWFSYFWFAALSRIKEDAKAAFMGINLHRFRACSPDAVKSTQQDVDNDKLLINIVTSGKKKAVVAAGAAGAVGGGAVIGALIGGMIGVIGGPVGLAVGAEVGFLIGAGIGAASGGGVGAAAGLAIIINAVRQHMKAKKQN